MKKIVVATLLAGVFGNLLQASNIKVYEIKSGKITYEIKGSSDIMGSKTQTSGKKRLIFSEYGAKRLEELAKIDKQNILGKKRVAKSHTMTYVKDGVKYSINFKHKRIMRLSGAYAGLAKADKEMMLRAGGKKVGEDKVLGYTCEVWDFGKGEIKKYLYKGLILKTVSNMMGVKNTEVAVKADFDIALTDEDFKMPDFPIYDMQGNKLDKTELNEMDKNSAVEAKETRKDMQKMRKISSQAMRDAGVKKGQRPTKKQEKKIENAMMNAMFPRIKNKMLSQSKALEFGKECLESANTLKEAKVCTNKMNKMVGKRGDSDFELESWDSKTKKETLKFLEQGIKSMNCVKKANNMQELQACMPRR